MESSSLKRILKPEKFLIKRAVNLGLIDRLSLDFFSLDSQTKTEKSFLNLRIVIFSSEKLLQ